MGVALGCIGLSFDDFCKLDYDEFESICKAWSENAETAYRDDWERARLMATICIQPHIKKRITPQKLLPLPWDNARKERKDSKPRRTMPGSRERFEEVKKRIGG